MTATPQPVPVVADEPSAELGEDPKKPIPWLRIGLLVLLLSGIVVAAKALGLQEYMTQDKLKALLDRLGLWGPVIFCAAFTLGELIQVPGWVFIGTAVAAYGTVYGGLLSFFAAVVSVVVAFWLVRGVAGKALSAVPSPLLQRLLGKLDERPLRTVIVLRTIFWVAPPLNYALALSTVKPKDYLVGSALGLIAPIALMAIFFEWLLAQDLRALALAYWPWAFAVIAVLAITASLYRCRAKKRAAAASDVPTPA